MYKYAAMMGYWLFLEGLAFASIVSRKNYISTYLKKMEENIKDGND